jgi:hypothetical protein
MSIVSSDKARNTCSPTRISKDARLVLGEQTGCAVSVLRHAENCRRTLNETVPVVFSGDVLHDDLIFGAGLVNY